MLKKQGHCLKIKYPIYLSATKATISVSTKMTEINNNKEEIWIISSFLQVRRSAKTKYHKDLTKLEDLFFMLHSVAILGWNKAVYVTASLLLSLLPPFQIFFPVYAIKCCYKSFFMQSTIKISKCSLLVKTKQFLSSTISNHILSNVN